MRLRLLLEEIRYIYFIFFEDLEENLVLFKSHKIRKCAVLLILYVSVFPLKYRM